MRRSGMLLPVASLPSKYGIGTRFEITIPKILN